ncbi:MAG: glycoside hydrolase family 73 protein [Bacteroidia bacterium]
MLRRCVTILLLLTIRAYSLPFYNSFTSLDYIAQYRELALKEMKCYNIPASIILAQAMVESGNGSSNLATNANNHFGIKCHKEWHGPTFIMDDDEKDECFRKYESVVDSYSDHSQFLCSRKWYAFLFHLPKTDYVAWARGLKRAGYATHPAYAEMLIEIIEKNRLYELDTMTLESIAPVLVAEKKEETRQFSLAARELLALINTLDFKKINEEPAVSAETDSLYSAYFNSSRMNPVDGNGSGFDPENNFEREMINISENKVSEVQARKAALNFEDLAGRVPEMYENTSCYGNDYTQTINAKSVVFSSCKNVVVQKTVIPLKYMKTVQETDHRLETPETIEPLKSAPAFKKSYFFEEETSMDVFIYNIQGFLIE